MTAPRWYVRLVGREQAQRLPAFMPYVLVLGPLVALAAAVAYLSGNSLALAAVIVAGVVLAAIAFRSTSHNSEGI